MSLVDAIPQTIKQIGAAQARGKAATGAIYGQTLADIGQMIGQLPERNRQRRSQAIQEQTQQMRLQQAQREQAADLAIQNATSAALNPVDGSIDPAKLAQHLAGTPGATKLPEIMEGFNRMQASALQLKSASINAQEAEDDALGALAYSASQLEDPEDQAALLATGLASAVKSGTIDQQKSKTLLGSLLGDQNTPDPTKVKTAISSLLSKSNKQRQMAVGDATKKAQEASAQAMADERKAKTSALDLSTKLQNFSSQLASAKTQARYAQVYNGVPPEIRGYFDAPEEWTAESGQRAIEATMDPSERIRLRHDRVTEDLDRRRTVAAEKRAGRTGSGAESPLDKKEAQTYARYKDFAAQYEKARDEERQRATAKDPYSTARDIPAYQPAPSYEKWQKMTPAERSTVIAQPNARIDDAELARRSGTATPVTPAAPTGAAPATASAPAAAGKTVTEAQLRAVAKLKGTTVDVQRERYRAGKYTIVP